MTHKKPGPGRPKLYDKAKVQKTLTLDPENLAAIQTGNNMSALANEAIAHARKTIWAK